MSTTVPCRLTWLGPVSVGGGVMAVEPVEDRNPFATAYQE